MSLNAKSFNLRSCLMLQRRALGAEGGAMVCRRCQGLLVCEIFDDLNIESGALYTGTRCINCG